jgi:hypothetical protein
VWYAGITSTSEETKVEQPDIMRLYPPQAVPDNVVVMSFDDDQDSSDFTEWLRDYGWASFLYAVKSAGAR